MDALVGVDDWMALGRPGRVGSQRHSFDATPSLQGDALSPPCGSIPGEWRQETTTVTSRLSYRLIQPAFELPLSLLRRDIARLLPAQIRSTRLRSVAADAGAILTEVAM